MKIIVPILITLTTTAGFLLYTRKSEKRLWNGGHCRRCGNKWEFYGLTYNSSRIYKCNECHSEIIIKH